MNKHEKRIEREALRQGFTLIEILVVVAIIGMLGAVAVPAIMSNLESSRIETTRVLIKNVETAAGTYKIKRGKYPTSLDVLKEPQMEGGDPWLEGDPVDPWGNELKYELQGKRKPKISSLGPDGQEGGGDDITNYDESKKGN